MLKRTLRGALIAIAAAAFTVAPAQAENKREKAEELVAKAAETTTARVQREVHTRTQDAAKGLRRGLAGLRGGGFAVLRIGPRNEGCIQFQGFCLLLFA